MHDSSIAHCYCRVRRNNPIHTCHIDAIKLVDSRSSNDKHLQRIRYEYDKYKEFYAEFGGNDPIG